MTAPIDRLCATLRHAGRDVKVKPDGRSAMAQCPAHADNRPSLCLTAIDGSVLIYCHAACDYRDILERLGLTPAALYDDPHGATYPYPDGRIVYRTATKKFKQSGNTAGTALFHGDRIANAETVYVVEGEKDVLTVESVGGAAVCSAMGAGKAKLADWTVLRDKQVAIVADDDKPGYEHAQQVCELLDGIAGGRAIVKAVEGKDVSDHIAAGHTLDDLRPWHADDIDDQFFSQRPILKHVRDFARARRVCPWSTLGALLVRAACQIPPHVVLPPLIGGHAAINLFVALVGPSGGGKGASEAAARDAIRFDGPITDIPEFPVGSGEGIARTFADCGSETVHTAIFSAPEIDTLAALFKRQGSTLEAELRKLAIGEQLGFANAQKSTRTTIPRHTYRAGLIVGVQPLRANALLASVDGGTPQRFLWLPVLDAGMPEQRPDPVDFQTVAVPTWPSATDGRYELEIPDTARREIDAYQIAVHHQDSGVDPLDGHALLTREKIAAALAVLDGRTDPNDDDWTLAGDLMARSTQTRTAIQAAIEASRRRENTAKALDTADRQAIVEARLVGDRQKRVSSAINKKLDRVKSHLATRRELLMACDSSIRSDFPAVFDLFVDKGFLVCHTGENGHVDRYGRASEKG